MLKIQKNKTALIILTAAAVFQAGILTSVLTYTARVKRYAEKENRIISFRCTARDPYDAFKGRYIALNLEEFAKNAVFDERTFKDFPDSIYKRTTAYALTEPVSGYARLVNITGFRKRLPDDGRIYIKTAIVYWQTPDDDKERRGGTKSGMLLPSMRFNFTDYYMQEDFAAFIDSLSAKDFNDLKPVIELYVAKNGACLQKSLTVFKTPSGSERITIEEYCKQKLQTENR